MSPLRTILFQLSWNGRRRGYITESCSIFVTLLPSRMRDLVSSSQVGTPFQRWSKSPLGRTTSYSKLYWPHTDRLALRNVSVKMYYFRYIITHPQWCIASQRVKRPIVQTWQFAHHGISPCPNKMPSLHYRWYSQHLQYGRAIRKVSWGRALFKWVGTTVEMCSVVAMDQDKSSRRVES